jgi:phosphohistidine phosphatase
LRAVKNRNDGFIREAQSREKNGIKTLILIRHAKSDWGDSSARDFDRALNARGKRDAPVMGQRLASRNIQPDAFIVSTACRAKTTARLMAPALGFSFTDIQWKDKLYLASPATMKSVICQTAEHVQTLALLAHNPGITELANQLAGMDIGNVPTCGVVLLELPAEPWAELNHARLLDFDYPKK